MFPAEYLHLTTEDAQRRHHDVNPEHGKNARRLPDATTRALAHQWAIDQGHIAPDAPRGALTATILGRYLDAVADGTTTDRAAIRRWARDQQLPCSNRGPLPEHVITAYRRDLAEKTPSLARRWARNHGYPVPRHATLAPTTIDAFSDYRTT